MSDRTWADVYEIDEPVRDHRGRAPLLPEPLVLLRPPQRLSDVGYDEG
ncbi:hypothetical protein [Fluviibacter phosphoraccumulans]|nr:hypothetical protein [Fluviibacter phosphoraccumulans]